MSTPSSHASDARGPAGHHHDDIVYPSAIPFLLVHVACLGVFWTGVTRAALAIGAALYIVRMFGVTAGYHRYFSHRAFCTSRVGQFVLAFIAQSTAQKSVLWWAVKHRHHHLFSDTPHDIHSPRHTGFLHAHVGWIFQRRNDPADLTKVADLAHFPELLWLHRLELLPAVLLGLAVWVSAGWAGLVVGFFWSTVAVYHATFCINSLAHVQGSRRYVTGDDSRNNFWLAVLTMGEGWHNNHHAYQSSARQGFRWWELDATYAILKVLAWPRLVWDLKTPPEEVLRNEQRLGARVIDRAASDLVASLDLDAMAASVKATLDSAPSFGDIQARLEAGQHKAAEILTGIHLPSLLTRDELGRKAQTMLVRTRSLDDIVERAHRLMLDGIGVRLRMNPTA